MNIEIINNLKKYNSIQLPNDYENSFINLNKFFIRVLNKNKIISYLQDNNINFISNIEQNQLIEFNKYFTDISLIDLKKTIIVFELDKINKLLIDLFDNFYKKYNSIENLHFKNESFIGTIRLYYDIRSNNILKIKFVKTDKISIFYQDEIFTFPIKNISKLFNFIKEAISKYNIKVIMLFHNHYLNYIEVLINYLKSVNLFYNLRLLITLHDWPKVLARYSPKKWHRKLHTNQKLDFNVHFFDKGTKDTNLYYKYLSTYFNNITKKNLSIYPNFCNDNFISEKKNMNPINKIIFTGSTQGNVYYQRLTFKNYCLKNSDKTYILKNIPQNEYLNEIYKYKSGFIGPANWNIKWQRNGYREYINFFITTKFFEYSALGLLLLVHDDLKDEVEKLGYKDKESCILTNENNYDEKVYFIRNLQNINIINKIREKGKQITINNYSEKINQKILINQINKI